jgi:Domain of Unknown Function (DUF928)
MRWIRTCLTIAVAGNIMWGAIADNSATAQKFVPKNRGLPGRREGGGTRGACVNSKGNLTAVMPISNSGLTTSSHPTFSWYVPETEPTMAEFVLLDRNEQEIYQTTFQVTGKAGIMSLTLPNTTTMPTLKADQQYRWKFAIACDNSDASNDMMTEGWVERVTPSPQLQAKLSGKSPAEQASLYAAEGIWYDAVQILADLRRTQPTLATQVNWQNLLQSVELNSLVTEPILPKDNTVPNVSATR